MPDLPLQKSTLTASEAATVAAICFGLFILWSLQAVLAGFPDASVSDAGNAWMIGLEFVLALSAMLYLRARGFDIASLYPHPTLKGCALGVALFFACWFAGAVVTAMIPTPGGAGVVDFSFTGALASTIAFALVNGTFEEVFLLGVLVRGLRGFGLSTAMGVPLLVRVLYHLYQGPVGAVWVASFGVVLTLSYLHKGQLWPPVFAHVLWDIVPTL